MTASSRVYPIANIVLPGTNNPATPDLCVHIDKNKWHFNTWMNTFAAKKYYQYCEIGKLYLNLQAKGRYRLEVIGSKRTHTVPREDFILRSQEITDSTCVEIPEANEYDGLYFSIITNPQESFQFISGAWCTDTPPPRQNKLAIITCTFKREEHISRNVALLEQFLQDTPEVSERIKLLIVDNGRTLPDTIKSNHVELYPNINAGGAGGFARGLIEARRSNSGYTRVLLMDDDVEVSPESFYRTLVIADYLKHEYKSAFINGAMMDLYQKNRFFENLAVQNGLWVHSYHAACNLSYDNVLKVNDIPEEVFHNPDCKAAGAWWYCCFELELVREKGYPLPIFIRADDLEWGWRNFGKTHLAINGICIWHAPFMYRVSKATEYYYIPRNMFMIQSIYTPSFKSWWKNRYQTFRKYLTQTYNYAALEMFTMALQDILKGDAAFYENPDEQMQRISKADRASIWKPCENAQEMHNALHPRPFKVRKIRKFLYNLTYKGQFCPLAFMKPERSVIDWFPPERAFTMVRKVKVYNPLKNQYEERKFDRAKHYYYKKTLKRLIDEIDQKYDELSANFRKAHSELTSEEFWKKYLNLND
ncbi:MAG: glycosyltransferase [Akkermansia sp.]|nr:glycosyltransferase [Akkermansia sp.]